MSLLAAISLPQSPFPPIALGFFGLGTSYLIYGPQELLGFPQRDTGVDLGTGVWGIWMPGFCQLLAGTCLFPGLTFFGTFTASPPLYTAALAFSAYGVRWFALGWNRLKQADPGVNLGMALAFSLISVLGIIVFAKAKDYPVMGLSMGLTCIYLSDILASLGASAPGPSWLGTRLMGFFHPGRRRLADVPHVRDGAGPRVQVHPVSVRPGPSSGWPRQGSKERGPGYRPGIAFVTLYRDRRVGGCGRGCERLSSGVWPSGGRPRYSTASFAPGSGRMLTHPR